VRELLSQFLKLVSNSPSILWLSQFRVVLLLDLSFRFSSILLLLLDLSSSAGLVVQLISLNSFLTMEYFFL
jgi:hypothetical protein